mmetsp:Transcript_26463/g.56828  ORF Transcript_26463/g.56828 Transcript_26463/m.56828 type:complete len:186 (-) Transcript_26463:43-600(-)
MFHLFEKMIQKVAGCFTTETQMQMQMQRHPIDIDDIKEHERETIVRCYVRKHPLSSLDSKNPNPNSNSNTNSNTNTSPTCIDEEDAATVISILLATKLVPLEPMLLATKYNDNDNDNDADTDLCRFDLAKETGFECNAAAAVTKLRLGPHTHDDHHHTHHRAAGNSKPRSFCISLRAFRASNTWS